MVKHQETRAFKVHPQLLFDVIQRQAGSLTKALGEGIMNSIDAKATRVDLTLTDKQASIVDDGGGFPSREYVENFFETFGQPHKAGDATYGTFRMGRGQMFSFGVNRWRSGKFAMSVDIKNRGLDYDLTEMGEDHDGCEIAIDLYTPLTMLQQREIADEVRRMVRYVEVPVRVNGELVNKRPASEAWDHEDDDAFYKFSGGRLSIYNLGVFVNDHRAYALGIGGTVVAKKQLRLNFARNDVLNDCPVWTRIARVLRKRADKNIQAKRSALSAEERAMLAQRLRSGDLTPKEAQEAAVFQDASGRWLTIAKLRAAAANCNHTISAGAKNARAEKVQKAHMAVVLNEALFDEFFRVDSLEELIAKVIKPNDRFWPDSIKVKPLDAFSPSKGERYDVVPPSAYTPNEAVVLAVANQLDQPDFAAKRKILLGDADHAHGWTDGESYIAIARSFLKGKTISSPETWTAVALLLAHEYSHGDASSSATHVHSPEFYEQYHDAHDDVAKWVADGLRFVRAEIDKVKGKVTRKSLVWLDAIQAAEAAPDALEQTLLAARAKHGRPAKAKPAKEGVAKPHAGGSYAEILTAQGYARNASGEQKGWQRWVAKNGDTCEIMTRNGAWTLARVGKPEAKGRLTPSLAKVFQ